MRDIGNHTKYLNRIFDEVHDAERIQREMDRILREQINPCRPSPLAERWAYLDKRDAEGRSDARTR